MSLLPTYQSDIVWLGNNSESSCEICLCSTTLSGQITVSGANADAGSVIDPSDPVSGGIGKINVTGIANGQSVGVYVGGTLFDTVTLYTKPAAGETFSIVASGCFGRNSPFPPAQHIARLAPDCRLFVSLGDDPYIEVPETGGTTTYWGETLRGVSQTLPLGTGLSTDKSAAFRASVHAHYRSGKREPAMRKALSFPSRFIRDDHTWPGNNRAGNFLGVVGSTDPATTGINFYYEFCADESEAAHYNAICDDVSNYWFIGNPPCNDAQRDPNWPASQSRWFRERYGDAEIWYLDIASYHDRLGAASPRLAIPTLCEEWLLDTMQASTATWKIVMNAREMYSDQDGWEWAPEQRDRIMAEWVAQSGWAVRGAVVCPTADNHMGGVKRTSGYVELVGCPGGIGVRPRPDGYIANETFKDGGYITSTAEENKYMTILRVNGSERLDLKLVNHRGNVRWHGYLLPGDMTVRRERRSVA